MGCTPMFLRLWVLAGAACASVSPGRWAMPSCHSRSRLKPWSHLQPCPNNVGALQDLHRGLAVLLVLSVALAGGTPRRLDASCKAELGDLGLGGWTLPDLENTSSAGLGLALWRVCAEGDTRDGRCQARWTVHTVRPFLLLLSCLRPLFAEPHPVDPLSTNRGGCERPGRRCVGSRRASGGRAMNGRRRRWRRGCGARGGWTSDQWTRQERRR